jgi:hypothetical protein
VEFVPEQGLVHFLHLLDLKKGKLIDILTFFFNNLHKINSVVLDELCVRFWEISLTNLRLNCTGEFQLRNAFTSIASSVDCFRSSGTRIHWRDRNRCTAISSLNIDNFATNTRTLLFQVRHAFLHLLEMLIKQISSDFVFYVRSLILRKKFAHFDWKWREDKRHTDNTLWSGPSHSTNSKDNDEQLHFTESCTAWILPRHWSPTDCLIYTKFLCAVAVWFLRSRQCVRRFDLFMSRLR